MKNTQSYPSGNPLSGSSPTEHTLYTIKDGARLPDSELDGREAKVVAALRFLNDEAPLPSREQILEELVQELGEKRQQAQSTQPSLPTSELVAGFLESKRGKVVDKSLESYAHTLKPFVQKYPHIPLTPEEVDTYLAKPEFKTAKARAGARTVISMLYKYAEQRHHVNNPMPTVGRIRVPFKEPFSFSLDELNVILEACTDDRIKGLVHLSVGHGYRCEELCRSNVGDIGDDGRIYVRGKEGREFYPLLPETREVLLRVAGGRKADEPLFLSQMGRRLSDRQCYNIIKELLRAAGVLDGKPKDYRIATHALRKTFSSLALDAGCDSKIVDRLLRHRTRKTDDLYLAIPFELLRRNLERYSPLRLNQNQGKLPKTEY